MLRDSTDAVRASACRPPRRTEYAYAHISRHMRTYNMYAYIYIYISFFWPSGSSLQVLGVCSGGGQAILQRLWVDWPLIHSAFQFGSLAVGRTWTQGLRHLSSRSNHWAMRATIICMHICIYIYIYRERDTLSEIRIYIYIYIYIYIHVLWQTYWTLRSNSERVRRGPAAGALCGGQPGPPRHMATVREIMLYRIIV